MQLGHYLFRNMQGALLVDSQGNSHQVTNVALRGVGWRHYAAAGIFLNLVLLPFEILTLGLMVRISITTQLGEPISLQQLKSQVLACMAKSTGNFKGRGGANEWRAPVDTAQSFSQLVGRLNLFREAA